MRLLSRLVSLDLHSRLRDVKFWMYAQESKEKRVKSDSLSDSQTSFGFSVRTLSGFLSSAPIDTSGVDQSGRS